MIEIEQVEQGAAGAMERMEGKGMKDERTPLVNTDTVLVAIKGYEGQTDEEGRVVFSTIDIAQEMGADEYPVRVACSWLRRYRIIEVVEGTTCMRRTRRTGERYTASLYRLRPQAEPADFNALFRVFGLGVRA